MPTELSLLTQLLKDAGPLLKDAGPLVLGLIIIFLLVRTRERLTIALGQIGGLLKAMLKYQEFHGTVLAKARLIKPEEQAQFIKDVTSAHASEIDRAMTVAKGVTNPLTRDDISRLRQYTDMLRQGNPFTPEQAQDFHRIAHVLQEDRSDEPSTAFLLALATFVLGVYLGPKRPRDLSKEEARQAIIQAFEIFIRGNRPAEAFGSHLAERAGQEGGYTIEGQPITGQRLQDLVRPFVGESPQNLAAYESLAKAAWEAAPAASPSQ